MKFLIESVLILSGLTAVIIGLCRGKKWLAALGAAFVISIFAGMFIMQAKNGIMIP